MRNDKIVMLTNRGPGWHQEAKSNVLEWVREGEDMTITFTAEQLKDFVDHGLTLTFIAKRVDGYV
jgi:pyruvate formate-lyase activating enzyme-like uncharacterized protein